MSGECNICGSLEHVEGDHGKTGRPDVSYNAITIVLQITDQETVENYKDVHPDYIFSDLRSGNLIDKCEMVDVVVE